LNGANYFKNKVFVSSISQQVLDWNKETIINNESKKLGTFQIQPQAFIYSDVKLQSN